MAASPKSSPNPANPTPFDALKKEALERRGPKERLSPEILELARTYYLTGCTVPQIHRLTGISQPSLEYHIYHRKDGNTWKALRDKITALRNDNLASCMVKVTNDYAEALMLQAERLLERCAEGKAFLTVGEQKQLADIIAAQQKSAIMREKLDLEVLLAKVRTADDSYISMQEAAQIIDADPVAAFIGKGKETENNALPTSEAGPSHATETPVTPGEENKKS